MRAGLFLDILAQGEKEKTPCREARGWLMGE